MIRSDHLSNIDQSILLKVRNMLFLVFLILGFIMATWIVRTPSIRDILNASIMQMGLVLLGFSIGSIAGIFSSQKITLKLGADRSITLGLCAALSGLITLSIGSIVSSIWIVSCGLGLIGAGIALSEVAVNFLGSHIERNLKTHVLTLIHACFSLGTVLGGVSGVILMAFNVDFIKHMLIVFALLCPITIYATTQLNNAPGSKLTNQNRQSNLIDTLRRDPQLIVIGFIVLAVALAEGTANDWLPLLIVDTYKVPEYFGSLIFIIFALTMTIGRFIGVRFLNTFNVATVMRVSSMIGALGILILVLSNNIYITAFAVVLWGIGASLGFPVAMSAGAGSGENAATRISILAMIGYTAFLVGPPMLGFVGEQIGLKMTMFVIFALLFVPIIFANTLNTEQKTKRPH